MKYILRPIHCVFIAILIMTSCAKNEKVETITNIENHHELVSAYTSGNIKRSATIVVRFTQPLTSQENVGQTLGNGVLRFSPSINGKTHWIATDAIEFIPEKQLPWKTKYIATLSLKNISKEKKEQGELVFNFQTPQKQFIVENTGLASDTESGTGYQINGRINTSDEFEPLEVEKLLSATQNRNKLEISWTHQPKSFYHSFSINGIERLESNSTVELKWDSSKANIENESGIRNISVPSLSDFSVTSANVTSLPDQYIEIFFSDPIKANTDFRGLIHVNNKAIQRVQVSNNVLKAYPAEKLTGLNTLVLNPDIESIGGNKLNAEVSYELNFGGLKPEVRLPGKGVIMPTGSGLFFPFEAAGLSAVDVRITKIFTNNIHQFLQNNDFDNSYQLNRVGRVIHRSKVELSKKGANDLLSWNTFKIDLSKLINVENGVIYNVEIGFRKSYSLFSCDNNDETDQYIPIGEEEFYPEKDYEWTYYNFYYNWQHIDNPCNQAYYAPYKFVNRNILGSNHGIIAKTDQKNKTYLFITNLLTTLPEANVNVQLYDFQNQLLSSGKTNNDGVLALTTDRAPFLVITKKEQTVGYLKIDNSTLQSTSNFDVEGKEVKKGVKGFLFGERDVWRPGDSIFVSFILEDKLQSLPMGHPLVFELYNPKGQMVHRMVNTRDQKYIYPLFFKTAPNDITGNWSIMAKIGPLQFSKNIRIETIKPNRLKINLNFDKELLSAQSFTRGNLEATWLHGAKAGALQAKIDVSFSPITPTFKNYRNFDFSAPYEKFYGEEKTIFDGKLNEQGKASIPFNYQPNSEVSCFLKASFTTKVFEPGGDFSINQTTMPFSPFPNYVGLKIDWSYKSWNKLNNDTENDIEVVTVDEYGNPIDLRGIDIKIFELDYRWWYNGNSENLANYAGATYHKPVLTTNINTKQGKGSFRINKDEDLWGRHLLLVTSPNGHSAGQVIYFGGSWGNDKHKGGAEMLAIITEKEQYSVNDEISVSFPANKDARALVTIENGSSIIGHEWLSNLSGLNKYSFKATPEMAPNIYIHITLIQPHGQTVNDLPIRLYGVVPIMVENAQTRLKPLIDQPEEVRPLKKFSIKISEENKQAMDYILAIVDEGLLDLTNFKTPDPWSAFFAREALGVNTYDLYNYVMGAWGTRLESMFAVGGSDISIDNSKKQAERFKPIVKVLGPFHLDARKKANHEITLPQYVGSVRTMVIAADNGKYGNAQQTLPVREPLMVLATLPRVLSPNETVDIPVTVFAVKKNIREVKVKIETNDFLISVDGTEKTLIFDETGEKSIIFKIKTPDKTGIAKFKVEVKSGGESSFYETELDIRTPNLPLTETTFKLLQPGEKWEQNITPIGLKGTNSAQIEIASMPALNLGTRLEFLITYPHGCVEQITSGLFPQLYLPTLSTLSKEESSRISKNISAGIEKLQRYQTSDGGFAYWPGNAIAHNWSSSYATFFLTEASKLGYMVPGNLLNSAMNFMRTKAADYQIINNESYYEQAFRLYLLALAGEPNVSGMNRLRGANKLNNQGKWLLAGAYAHAGMKEAAYQLIDFRNMKPDEPQSHNFGSYLRDESIMLLTLIALNESEKAMQLAIQISEKLSTGEWYSTQSTAFALLALSNFATSNKSSKELYYEISLNGKASTKKSNKPIDVTTIENENGAVKLAIENKGKGNLFVNLTNIGTPSEIIKTAEMKGLRVIVTYMNEAGKAFDIEKIEQGTDFSAVVSISNQSGIAVENIALSQLFPAGWEIINTRLFGNNSSEQSTFDYQDIRDDRVFTYFGLKPYENKQFRIKLNATYSGNYKVPSVHCGAMYNNNFKAHTEGFETEVTKR
ncbi:MAG TPA: MG2 domain-containing protein [Prolixibacteraceae bacterium]|nr:MG2 domain-containing protein [Prolixibacteraceae bacterium]